MGIDVYRRGGGGEYTEQGGNKSRNRYGARAVRAERKKKENQGVPPISGEEGLKLNHSMNATRGTIPALKVGTFDLTKKTQP